MGEWCFGSAPQIVTNTHLVEIVQTLIIYRTEAPGSFVNK